MDSVRFQVETEAPQEHPRPSSSSPTPPGSSAASPLRRACAFWGRRDQVRQLGAMGTLQFNRHGNGHLQERKVSYFWTYICTIIYIA